MMLVPNQLKYVGTRSVKTLKIFRYKYVKVQVPKYHFEASKSEVTSSRMYQYVSA